MAVRQFNRKRPPRITRKASKAAARSTGKPRSSQPTSTPSTRPSHSRPPVSNSSGRAGSFDDRAAALTVVAAMQSVSAALIDVESLLRTVHEGHERALKSLSNICLDVAQASADFKTAFTENLR